MFQSGQIVRSKSRTPEMDAGRHHPVKLGFILMSTDPSAEGDFKDTAPAGLAVYITRPNTVYHTTNETLARHIDHMADAAGRIQPKAKPVITSNQVQMWSYLRRAGIADELKGFGRLFSCRGTSLRPR